MGNTAAAATCLVDVLPSCMPGCQVHPCMPPPSLRPPHSQPTTAPAADEERDAALVAQLKAELGASLVERKSPFK